MLQNGKSVYSLWILIPSVSYPFLHNVTQCNVAMLHTPQLVWMPRSYLDIQITPKPITSLPICVSPCMDLVTYKERKNSLLVQTYIHGPSSSTKQSKCFGSGRSLAFSNSSRQLVPFLEPILALCCM